MLTDPYDGLPYKRPLCKWLDEVKLFRDDVLKGKVAAGQSQRLSNGYLATYDGDHIVTYQRSGLIVDIQSLTVIEDSAVNEYVTLKDIDDAAREAVAVREDADAWAEECCRLVVEADRYPNGTDKRLFAAAASLRDLAEQEAEAAELRMERLFLRFVAERLRLFGFGRDYDILHHSEAVLDA